MLPYPRSVSHRTDERRVRRQTAMQVALKRYPSAEAAFASLRPAGVIRKRHAAQRLKRVARIFDVAPPRNPSLQELVACVLDNNDVVCGRVLNKSVKVTQTRDSGVVVFSDVHHVDTELLDEFADTCTAAGLPTRAHFARMPAPNVFVPLSARSSASVEESASHEPAQAPRAGPAALSGAQPLSGAPRPRARQQRADRRAAHGAPPAALRERTRAARHPPHPRLTYHVGRAARRARRQARYAAAAFRAVPQ